jgi:hypothetical protein
MLEVLIDHQNGCRICIADDPQGCVPYRREQSELDINAGYVRLVGVPAAIDVLHEVRQFPPLGPVLHAINGDGYPWETIGCGPAQFKRKNDPGSYFAGTYLHVVFRDARLNFLPEKHRAVAFKFGELWNLLPGVGIDVIVDPLAHYWGQADAWALKFEIAGKGASFDEAWGRAVAGLQAFQTTFQSIDLADLVASP